MASRDYLDDTAWNDAAGEHRATGWQAARRHSRLVRVLRIGLPVATVLIVAVMLLSLRALPSRVGDVELGAIGLSGTTLTMEAPSLTGYGTRGMTYEVDAERARQDITKPHVVHLDGIAGTLRQAGGGWSKLTAARGVYDREANTLRLEDSISLETHDGRRAFLREADVDLENQSVVSGQPVRVELPDTVIVADGMEATEGGGRLVMRGGVRVELRLGRSALSGDGNGR